MKANIKLSGEVSRYKGNRGSAVVDCAVILFLVLLAAIAAIKGIETSSKQVFDLTTNTIKDFEHTN